MHFIYLLCFTYTMFLSSSSRVSVCVCVLEWSFCNSFSSTHHPCHSTPCHTHSHYGNGDYHRPEMTLPDAYGTTMEIVWVLPPWIQQHIQCVIRYGVQLCVETLEHVCLTGDLESPPFLANDWSSRMSHKCSPRENRLIIIHAVSFFRHECTLLGTFLEHSDFDSRNSPSRL